MSRVRSPFYEGIRPQLRWQGEARVPHDAQRVAVVAHYAASSRLTGSFDRLIHEFVEHDYFVIVSSACTDPAALEFRTPPPAERVAILRKPNIGYDFGSWAVAFAAQPQIFEAGRVLQVNDSLVGPFWSLDGPLAHFEASYGDWWGLVRSHQVAAHLQSFFIGYTPAVLQSRTFQDFWAAVRPQPTKDEVIRRYEFGLSERLRNEAFAGTAFVEGRLVTDDGLNPVIDGWLETLRAGVPFVKRELLTRSGVVAFGDRIPVLLRQEFDIDVREWL